MKQRVIALMSGGVDSSVSAALLKKQGYDVVGVYILGWTGTTEFPCSWQKEEADARAVADQLQIPFHTLNLSRQYEQSVINQFFAGYRAGMTPNPDILCNQEIKFKAVWEAVRQLEPDFISTGHYARVKDGAIFEATDATKDQTYFLWGIDRGILPKIIFPLGELKKSDVRALARKLRLPTASKKDSQGICFVGPLKVREFLRSQLQPVVGPAVLADGRKVGEHQGATLYTIGQRLGAGSVNWTGDAPPLFVVAKDTPGNRLIVGADQDTYATELVAGDPNWLVTELSSEFRAEAKVRYRQTAVEVVVKQQGNNFYVKFAEPVRALTPGQSIVFYRGGQLLGGAVIKSVPAQQLLVERLYGSKNRRAHSPATVS